MSTSLVAAWFIVPFGDPLLVDATTLPSFLLLAASLGWIFRQVTGASGLAVVPWFTVALLQVPLVRDAVLMSADLPFTASFLALVAAVLALVEGERFGEGIVLAGAAAGLLVGCKATGAPAALLLCGTALCLGGPVARRAVAPLAVDGTFHRDRAHRPRGRGRSGRRATGSTTARRWHLSACGWPESRSFPARPSWARATRSRRRRRFGGTPPVSHGSSPGRSSVNRSAGGSCGSAGRCSCSPSMHLAGFRRGDGPLARRRLALVAYAVGPGVVLTVLVACAPWSGLRSEPRARAAVVLTVIVLLSFIGPVSLFPLGLASYAGRGRLPPASRSSSSDRSPWRPSPGRRRPTPPRVLVDVAPGILGLAAIAVAVWLAVAQWGSPALARSLVSGGLVVVSLAAGAALARRDTQLPTAARPAPSGCRPVTGQAAPNGRTR